MEAPTKASPNIIADQTDGSGIGVPSIKGGYWMLKLVG